MSLMNGSQSATINDTNNRHHQLNYCEQSTTEIFLITNVPRTFPCVHCSKKFSTSGNLKNHISTIHFNYRPFKCSFPCCDKEYSNQSRLKVHLRTHYGLKPYTCDTCLKSFNEIGNLKTHMRLHSLERPFNCSHCDKSYKTKGHLKDHINIHHKEMRKFECKICGNKFGRSSTLKAHLRTHSGEKPYKCPLSHCCKYFAEKGNMQIHYKRHLKKLSLRSHLNAKPFLVINPHSEESLMNAMTRPCSKLTLEEDVMKVDGNNNNSPIIVEKESRPMWINEYPYLGFEEIKESDVHKLGDFTHFVQMNSFPAIESDIENEQSFFHLEN